MNTNPIQKKWQHITERGKHKREFCENWGLTNWPGGWEEVREWNTKALLYSTSTTGLVGPVVAMAVGDRRFVGLDRQRRIGLCTPSAAEEADAPSVWPAER